MTTVAAVRWLARRVIGGLWVAVLIGSGPAVTAAATPEPVLDSMRAQALEAAQRRQSLSPAQRKVASQIVRYAWPEEIPRARIQGALAGPPDVPWHQAGRLHVIVTVTGTASADIATLRSVGLEIEIVNARFGLVQGWIADAAVAAFADMEIVKGVSPAWPAEHTVGSVTSEGDHASRADLVRQLGYDGTGVVVGVISGGIDSLANAQATGDLGAVTVPSGCQRVSGNDEGTAMLEIVHDLAPGATLLFSSDGDSPLAFIDAVNCLKAAGADVIVDDVVFFSEPAFEDGPIAQTVREAVQAGVSYFTSAGNFAQVHVEQSYCPGPDALHDFGCGTGSVAVGMIVPPGGQVVCSLQWNDPFGGSTNDYDLLAVDTLGDLLAASTNVQDGTQDPFELVAWANPLPFSVEVHVGIALFSGAARLLDLFCPMPSEAPGSLFFVTPNPGGSIFGHAAVPKVVSVAAVDVMTPGLATIESYSSEGPVDVFFPTPEIRAKPDIASFDDVSTTVPVFIPFRGTSAAAPHAAAIAALLLSKNPSLTPGQVQSMLTSNAVDIGAPGFDDAAGFGRLDALAALGLPTATSTTTTSTFARPTTSSPTSSTATTLVSTSTTLASTSSTTLPPCDPTDCDGNVCTVGDRCVAGVCQAGNVVTPGQASGFVFDRTHAAAAACAGDQAKVVKKIVRPLMRVGSLLRQAGGAPSAKKLRRRLGQARGAAGQAQRQFAKAQGKLSSNCVASLTTATTSAGTELSCLP
jgi:subtilisin family serine protease